MLSSAIPHRQRRTIILRHVGSIQLAQYAPFDHYSACNSLTPARPQCQNPEERRAENQKRVGREFTLVVVSVELPLCGETMEFVSRITTAEFQHSSSRLPKTLSKRR